jgi:hypothetical protein
MKRMLISMLILWTMSLLPACGGGGGGTDQQPTKAVVKILTSGTLPSGTHIGGIDATLNLPAGVSVKAVPDTLNPNVLQTDSGVIAVSGVASGSNAAVIGTYTATQNAVSIHVVNAVGFGTGEFVTVTCNLASGATVTAGSITAPALSAVDLNGAPITGLTAGVSVELR